MANAARRRIERRLRAIGQRQGGVLTPSAVVDDARSVSSPLHSHFEWDDTKASEAYRLEQARKLIRSVKVQYLEGETALVHAKYVHCPRLESGDQGYVETVTLREDEESAREVARRELRHAMSLLQRACDIAAVLGLESEFKDVIARSELLLRRVA